MRHVYRIVRHDDGWAYTVNGVFSEPFPTHAEVLAAARTAAAEQRVPGHTEVIEYEDECRSLFVAPEVIALYFEASATVGKDEASRSQVSQRSLV